METLATVIILISLLTAFFHLSLMHLKTIGVIALLCGLCAWFLYPLAIVQNKKMLLNLFETLSVADVSLLIVIENTALLGVNWFQMHHTLKLDKPLKPKIKTLLKLGTYFPGITLFFCLFFLEVQVFLLGMDYEFTKIALAVSLTTAALVVLLPFILRKLLSEKLLRIELTCLLRGMVILAAVVFASSPSGHRQVLSAQTTQLKPLLYLTALSLSVIVIGFITYKYFRKKKIKF